MDTNKIKQLIEEGFKNFQQGTHLAYATIGELFCLLKKDKNYKNLGYKNMNELFVDLGQSRSLCYNIIDYRELVWPYVEKNQCLQKIPASTLCQIIPMIKKQPDDKKEQYIEKLKEISSLPDSSEMKDEIKRMSGLKTQLECNHENTEQWFRCKDCHKFLKR